MGMQAWRVTFGWLHFISDVIANALTWVKLSIGCSWLHVTLLFKESPRAHVGVFVGGHSLINVVMRIGLVIDYLVCTEGLFFIQMWVASLVSIRQVIT